MLLYQKKLYSNAKLNLYLEIVGKREDGYHLLETVMVPVSLYDEIDMFIYKSGSINVDVNKNIKQEDNIVYKTVKLIQEKYNLSFGFSAIIKKNIPVGGGLGGGSSNCAFVLKELNNYFKFATTDELLQIGATLGADVPFFIINKPAFCEGIGDIITPIDFPKMDFTIVSPYIFVETKKIFQNIKNILTNDEIFGKKLSPEKGVWEEIVESQKTFYNKLERVSLFTYSELSDFKKSLNESFHMTGSGASFYGNMEAEGENSKYTVFRVSIL